MVESILFRSGVSLYSLLYRVANNRAKRDRLSATKVLRRHLSDDSPLIQSMFSSWLFVTIIRNLWSKDLERWIVEPGSRYLDRSKAALVLLRKIQVSHFFTTPCEVNLPSFRLSKRIGLKV